MAHAHVTTAQEYHGGQWSALYKFQCNGGRVLNYQHRTELIREIEACLADRFDEVINPAREQIRLLNLLAYVYETECDDSPAMRANTIMLELLQHDEDRERCCICGMMRCKNDCTMRKIQQWVDDYEPPR